MLWCGMSDDDPHPLKKWLERKKLSIYRFAVDNDIAFRTLYDHVSGRHKAVELATALKIENGTDGAVTAHKQAAWLARQHAPAA